MNLLMLDLQQDLTMSKSRNENRRANPAPMPVPPPEAVFSAVGDFSASENPTGNPTLEELRNPEPVDNSIEFGTLWLRDGKLPEGLRTNSLEWPEDRPSMHEANRRT